MVEICGYNNNPSCLHFWTAYKKLSIRAEICNGGIGNCVPLQQINILNCDLIKKGLVELINDSNIIYNAPEEEEVQITDSDHEYTLFCSSKSLSDFSEHVVVYISGFVAKKIGSLLKCEKCVGTLFGLKTNIWNSFIAAKDSGGLAYPSNDTKNYNYKSWPT